MFLLLFIYIDINYDTNSILYSLYILNPSFIISFNYIHEHFIFVGSVSIILLFIK